MLRLLSGVCRGGSDSVPSHETPRPCYCHQDGHGDSLQPSEINTSRPAACFVQLGRDGSLIQGDRGGALSQQSGGVLTVLGH